MDILFRTIFGSRIYGTSTPSSDTDLKTVFVPSAQDIIFQRANNIFQKNTKSDTSLKNSNEDIDDEFISIFKFMNMIKSGDMVATELLFIPFERAEVVDRRWKDIVQNRKYLLSSKVSGFVGYIRKQAAKYGVKGSRVAAVRKVLKELHMIDLLNLNQNLKIGDYEKTWVEMSAEDKFINIIGIEQSSGEIINFLEINNKKIPFGASINLAEEMLQKMMDNYGQRALQAESNSGVDWKSLQHAVRVSEQAIELLTTGHISFPRPNYKELINMKSGKYTYNEIQTILETNLDIIEKLRNDSVLADEINLEYIDKTLETMYVDQVLNTYK